MACQALNIRQMGDFTGDLTQAFICEMDHACGSQKVI
jgi:hypothetical protein